MGNLCCLRGETNEFSTICENPKKKNAETVTDLNYDTILLKKNKKKKLPTIPEDKLLWA